MILPNDVGTARCVAAVYYFETITGVQATTVAHALLARRIVTRHTYNNYINDTEYEHTMALSEIVLVPAQSVDQPLHRRTQHGQLHRVPERVRPRAPRMCTAHDMRTCARSPHAHATEHSDTRSASRRCDAPPLGLGRS